MESSCRFCGATEGLAEGHVFPRWLRGALDLDGGRVQMRFGPDDDGLPETVVQDALELTFGAVCGECARGWLIDLEGDFRALMRPAVEGGPRSIRALSKTDQAVIATWAVKTWFLAEQALSHVRGAAAEGEGIPTALRSRNEPPDMTQVWVGQIEPGHSITLSSVAVWNDSDQPRGTLGVLVVGRLVMVIYAAIEIVEGTWRGLGLDQGAFHQIWPPMAEEVSWPPAALLTDEVLQGMFGMGAGITV
jgi:hypothetical protein